MQRLEIPIYHAVQKIRGPPIRLTTLKQVVQTTVSRRPVMSTASTRWV